MPKAKIRHFDRSCSQSYRERRSGEIRFSTSAVSPPRRRASRCLFIQTSNQNHPKDPHQIKDDGDDGDIHMAGRDSLIQLPLVAEVG